MCSSFSDLRPVLGFPPFSLIAFDWDGTAVASRNDSAEPLRPLVEQVLARDVVCAIITGTNFENIERQFVRLVRAELRSRLFVCTNRGSEVYGFDAGGARQVLWRRTATAQENQLMDEVAQSVRETLREQYGLETEIIFNRLNRRKLDLIPVPEWSDPPKERIGELLRVVEERLARHKVSGGIQTVIDLVLAAANRRGISLRITTDVKHVEFGLTDKSDSALYIIEQLAPRNAEGRVDTKRILFVGDEFGPIGGFAGSDYKMVIPQAEGATYVSVGAEPNGVPAGVIHIGGGVKAFHALLKGQIALRG